MYVLTVLYHSFAVGNNLCQALRLEATSARPDRHGQDEPMMHSTREGPCAIAHTQRFFHNGSNMLRQALLVALALGPVAALPKHITVDSRERFVQLGGPYDVSTNGNEDELYIKISRLAAERRNPEGTRAPVRWDRMGLFAQPPDTMEKAIAWLDSTGECVFDTAFAGHYSLFNSSAVQDMARDPSGKHAAEAKYRAAGRMALYFANCDAPDTKVFFKAKVATSKDVLEDVSTAVRAACVL